MDYYQNILDATTRHRSQHRCKAYPFGDGVSLGVLAAAAGARRIVECGTALGYTACWFARGSTVASIDTIDFDEQHVLLARENIAEAGFNDRITVHHGTFHEILPRLTSGYDIAFFDGFAPSLQDLNLLASSLRVGGMLISTNLGLGGRETAQYREMLANPATWMTSMMAEGGRTAVSVKLKA
ncbi:class I SAM-dependent methyltransferase [Rhizobium sp. BG4]|uniref:O-methyltransferase n=1 Tax=Rhizobium sp. BG4 TaxID=2613770 RepID=UPI00193CCC79|nr:class I SAM-dependent methyltransferase [Rhizobium sp. BG4]QRM47227.1 hypothetical protein F2982_28025 [Rhizobium sp. BG4]